MLHARSVLTRFVYGSIGRKTVLRLVVALCFAGLCAAAANSARADVSVIEARAINKPYQQDIAQGMISAFTAPDTWTFSAQQDNETCRFMFWSYDGATSSETAAGFGETTGTATAWYYCTSFGGGGGGGPAGIELLRFNAVAGTFYSDPNEPAILSASPSQFMNGCSSTPCGFSMTSGGQTLASVTAHPTGPQSSGVGVALTFDHWYTISGGQLNTVTTSKLNIQNPQQHVVAISVYDEATPVLPGGIVVIPEDRFRIDIPRICLYVYGGIEDCPGCGGNRLCLFEFYGVPDMQVWLTNGHDKVYAKAKPDRLGVLRMAIDGKTVDDAGGLENMGLRMELTSESPRNARRFARFSIRPVEADERSIWMASETKER